MLDPQSVKNSKWSKWKLRLRNLGQSNAPFLRIMSVLKVLIFNNTRGITLLVLVQRDEDGYYWITGRVDDVINVRTSDGYSR